MMTHETVPLNRAQRRQRARQLKQEMREIKNAGKDRARIRRILAAELNARKTTTLEVLDDCRPFADGELLDQEIMALDEWRSLIKGAGKIEDRVVNFGRLAMRLTLARARAADIGNAADALFASAHAAMDRARERYQRTGSLAFDAQGLEIIPQALNLGLEIIAASSPRQMKAARDKTARAIDTSVRQKLPMPHWVIRIIGDDGNG